MIPAGRAGGTIEVVAGIALVDGETFTIGDGVTFTTFEFRQRQPRDARPRRGAVLVALHHAAGARRVIAVVNGEHELQVTAAASPLPVQSHVVVLTNGSLRPRHGNVPVASTVAHGSFAVAGMMGGVGESVDVRFSGGAWRTSVGPGSGKRYFEARGCRRLSVDGIYMQLGAVGANEYGFGFRSIGDVHSPTLSNLRVESVTPTFGFPGAKLVAAAYFAATNGGAITDIRVTDVRAPDACTAGVLLDRNSGASIDASPIVQGCDFAGASNAWLALNDAVDVTFPIIAGNRGGRTWQVGTADPSAISAAVQGSRYTRQAGDATTEWPQAERHRRLRLGARARRHRAPHHRRRRVARAADHVHLRLPHHDHARQPHHRRLHQALHRHRRHRRARARQHDRRRPAHHHVDGAACTFSLIWDAAASAWRVLGAPRRRRDAPRVGRRAWPRRGPARAERTARRPPM